MAAHVADLCPTRSLQHMFSLPASAHHSMGVEFRAPARPFSVSDDGHNQRDKESLAEEVARLRCEVRRDGDRLAQAMLDAQDRQFSIHDDGVNGQRYALYADDGYGRGARPASAACPSPHLFKALRDTRDGLLRERSELKASIDILGPKVIAKRGGRGIPI